MIFSVIPAHLFILDSVVDGRPLVKLQTLSTAPDEKKKRTTDVQILLHFFRFSSTWNSITQRLDQTTAASPQKMSRQQTKVMTDDRSNENLPVDGDEFHRRFSFK